MAPHLLKTIDEAEISLDWALNCLSVTEPLVAAATATAGLHPSYGCMKGKAEETLKNLRELQAALGRKKA